VEKGIKDSVDIQATLEAVLFTFTFILTRLSYYPNKELKKSSRFFMLFISCTLAFSFSRKAVLGFKDGYE